MVPEVGKSILFKPSLLGGRFNRKQYWIYLHVGSSVEQAISYMLRDLGLLSSFSVGYDIGMLLKHYRRAITKTEAEDYYNITPDSV